MIQSTESLGACTGPGERNHVRAELAQIAVELAREADRARDARETGTHKVVEVT